MFLFLSLSYNGLVCRESLASLEKDRLIADFLSYRSYDNYILAAPNNHAEILIPLENDVIISRIDGIRSFKLIKGEHYFSLPRSKALFTQPTIKAHLFVFKINPLFAVDISIRLDRISRFEDLFRFPTPLLKSTNQFSIIDLDEVSKSLYQEMRLNVRRKINYDIVREALTYIEMSEGRISVKEICNNLNVSKGRLERHFKNVMGIYPKEYCKVHKLNVFINTFKHRYTLTEHAHHCGYYDQSHLIKDFRNYLGITPKEFFRL